jgi:hypothetical protein
MMMNQSKIYNLKIVDLQLRNVNQLPFYRKIKLKVGEIIEIQLIMDLYHVDNRIETIRH